MSLLKRIISPRAEADSERGWSTGEVFKQSLAGERVSPSRANAVSTYFACVRNISEDCAKLPLMVYRRLARGKERAVDFSLYPILKTSPNPQMVSMVFRETLTSWALGWGNAYAEIVFDAGGRVRELYPIHPSRVRADRDSRGGMLYRVRNNDLTESVLSSDRVLHLHGLGADGAQGYSIAQVAAESLGIALASQTFAATFYGNGTHVGGVLETPKALKPEARANLRDSWKNAYGGSYNAHKVAVLEEDLKWKPITIPLADAQFLETRRFQHEEVARWFRMPLSKLQDSQRAQGWSTLDALNTDYVTDTLTPWLVRWEQECMRKLLLPAEQSVFFIEHEIKGMMRGDHDSRSKYYRERFNLGSLTPNEIRELENENPISDPAADLTYIQGAMVPLEKAGQHLVPKSAPAASAEPEELRTHEELASLDLIGALWPVFLDAANRVWKKEVKATEHAQKRCHTTDELAKWLVGFHLEQRQYALDAFAPILKVLGLEKKAILAAVSVQIDMWPGSGGDENPHRLAQEVQNSARAAEAIGGTPNG